MRFRTLLLGSTALGIAAGVEMHVASVAQAQEIEEIVVTARQREESLTDVPGTVNVLTTKTLESAGVQRAGDFINLTPGVSLVDSAEVGDTQVNIRGLNSSRDAEQSFAFVVDGILMTNTAAFNREFVDLQQIEIFKGPQGAIYGRNAAAGAILVSTRAPGNEFEARLKANYGEGDNGYLISGSVAGPLVEDELFARLSADYRNRDGFYKNTFLNADDVVDNFQAHNISARVVWTPNPNLDVDLKARYGKVDGSSITFNAIFALPGFDAFLPGLNFFEDVNDHEFVFQPNIDPTNNQTALEISGKFDYDMGWATLTGWTLYSDIENDFLSDGTSGAFFFFATEPNCVASTEAVYNAGITLPAPQFLAPTSTDPSNFLGPYTPTTCDGYQYQERFQEDISFELRLTSPGEQRLRWQTGIYVLEINRRVGVATGIDPTFFGGTIIESLDSPLTEALVHDKFDSSVFAVFGNVQYDLDDTVEVSVALRYDREKRKVDNLVDPTRTTSYIGFNLPSANVLNPGLDPVLNPNLEPDGSIPSGQRTFEQLQPKLSVTWDVSPGATLFASWGVGFKSGGFNNQGSAATVEYFINPAATFDPFGSGVTFAPLGISDIFKKETSSAFELGFKADFLGGMGTIEGAGYYTKVNDMQFFEFLAGPFGLLRVVNGIDEVSIWGGELSLNVKPTDSLTLFAAGNITESEIKRMDSRPDTVGNKSPYTPDYTINAGFEYTRPLGGSGINWMTRLDFQYVGPTWFHVVQAQDRPTIFGPLLGFPVYSNNSRSRRDAYETINLRFGLEAEGWSVVAYVKNLTDNDYVQEVVPAPEFGGCFCVPSDRRSMGVEMSLHY